MTHMLPRQGGHPGRLETASSTRLSISQLDEASYQGEAGAKRMTTSRKASQEHRLRLYLQTGDYGRNEVQA